MASTEIQRDERIKLLRHLNERLATRIASELLKYPPVRRHGDDYFPEGTQEEAEPTADQIKAVRHGLGDWILDLVGSAIDQQGIGGGRAAVNLLCRFFVASGMIQRLRCEEVARRHTESKAKGRPDFSHIPAVWPKWVKFWSTPRINYQSRLDGLNCLEGVSRDELIEVAVEFYRTGIRCSLFEKCLIEALLCAELYATVKRARNGELSTTFIETILRGLSFAKTLGDEPRYSLYILIGYILKGIISLGVFGALTAWAFISYEHEANWKNVMALVALALVAVAVVSRRLVRLIVKWSQADAKVSAALFLRKHPVFRAITELESFAKIVTAPAMSTVLARDAALRCYSSGGLFDQIIVPYLDRATAGGEFLWSIHYQPSGFDDFMEDTDVEAET